MSSPILILKEKILPNLFKIIILILLLSQFAELKAQNYLDSKGTDFWLTFLPNFHNDRYLRSDSLYIFVTAEVPTQGRIEYTDINNITRNRNFQINDPTQIYTFGISYYDNELFGYNNSGDLTERYFSEIISNVSFHVTTNNEVTVYAHSQAVTTSDAFLVLPTDALGKNYFIMSYKSDGHSTGASIDVQSTPSQFVIVATEDNTNVTIIPKVETRFNGRATQQITLQKGQSYLIQADIQRTMLNNDLTGSEIVSDKPVAVFAGHQRASVPVTSRTGPSRDCLIEQMPTVSTWGKNAYVIPYEQPQDIDPSGTDLFRILAAFDNTEIYENDMYLDVINKGEFREYPLTEPHKITASKPILVTQLKKTSGFNAAYRDGDPFMMVIPPVEQFMSSYRVINAQAYETIGKVYDYQYILIVAPTSVLGSVFLDGLPVAANRFSPIPTSNYSFANVRVNDNVHTVECDEGIGIYVYGYGNANSYGYVGGMNFRPLDLLPPEIVSKSDCFKVTGHAYDSTAGDSHLKEVISPDTSKENVTVTIEKFTPYKDSVRFSAVLNNEFLDGKFSIFAEDSIGFKASSNFYIPGFTVSTQLVLDKDSMLFDNQTLRTKKPYSIPYTITNYGKFPQTIQSVYLKNSNPFNINYITPKTLQPGETDTIWVDYFSDTDSVYIDTLIIGNICKERDIYALKIIFEYDRKHPQILKHPDSCLTTVRLIVTDSTTTDFGIASLTIADTTNCSIRQLSSSIKVCLLELTVKDPYRDAFYRIIAVDSAGHQTEVTDTIQGFTISFPDFAESIAYIDYGIQKIGFMQCDTVRIYNYGLFPITFQDAFMTENLIFSVPQSQFPIVIKPGASLKLSVCFRPLEAVGDTLTDTLNIIFNCLKASITLKGTGEPLVQIGNSKCDVPLKITTYKVPDDFSLGQNFPNPTGGTTKIEFGVGAEGLVLINLYDIMGNKIKTIVDAEFKPGVYEAEFSTQDLPQGVYFYEMRTKGVKMARRMTVSY